MRITYKDLLKVNYPAYILPSDEWYEKDKVLFIGDKVLDEKNMPGKSLGVRRIQSRRGDLQPLKKCAFDAVELIKSKRKYFIDSKGVPFTYEKSYSSKLKCYKIKNIELKEVASLVWLHEVPNPFTIPRPPLDRPQYARLLHIGNTPWLLYDYVFQYHKDTYRRV